MVDSKAIHTLKKRGGVGIIFSSQVSIIFNTNSLQSRVVGVWSLRHKLATSRQQVGHKPVTSQSQVGNKPVTSRQQVSHKYSGSLKPAGSHRDARQEIRLQNVCSQTH